jgi:hypothetical protein
MNTYLNYIVFIITTILYYSIKSSPDATDTNTVSGEEQVQSSNYTLLFIYFLTIIISQFFINSYILSETCGNNFTNNLKDSAYYTILPWTLIFGMVIIVLIAYPDIKSAFSDVYGYYYVAGSTNNILVDLLDNNTTKDQNPAKFDLIQKIYANKSLLVNQIFPSNFNNYWEQIKNLFKPDLTNVDAKKEELRKLVYTRDSIGEGMWYIYTGILICSLVQLKLSSVSCNSDQETLEANYKKFKSQQAISNPKK